MWSSSKSKKVKKTAFSKIDSQNSFEEIDHRLACGWYSDPQDSAQRKRFVKQLGVEKLTQQHKLAINIQSIQNPGN
mgnify:CR=1 FL=1